MTKRFVVHCVLKNTLPLAFFAFPCLSATKKIVLNSRQTHEKATKTNNLCLLTVLWALFPSAYLVDWVFGFASLARWLSQFYLIFTFRFFTLVWTNFSFHAHLLHSLVIEFSSPSLSLRVYVGVCSMPANKTKTKKKSRK